MNISIETISPSVAEELLKENRGNRTVRARIVKLYADAMAGGDWKETHQGLAFSADGRLLDGQHRLHAIVKSGVTLQMPVMRDMDASSFMCIDQGVKRSIADAIGTDRKVAEVLKFAATIMHATGQSTPAMALSVPADIGRVVSNMDNASKARSRVVSAVPSRLAGAIVALRDSNENYVVRLYADMAKRNYSSLPPLALSFVKQADTGTAQGTHPYDLFARAMKVFDVSLAQTKTLRVSASEIQSSIDYAREFLNNRNR